ncbi:MAG TPA: DoxX family protein [Solirubrobacteraceae bacterium]|jgi:putative oxidoreductase|nr:DoxX family protein [Solirubrobacteraceae bacterium]
MLGLALLRAVVGGLFMGHGLQKLIGWFEGHGLQATGESFEAMGLRPGKAHATAAGLSETAGGALVAAGLLTPLGASLLSGTMITAIRKVHAANGVWVSKGGYEYNLVLLAAVFAITDVGPGRLSLDEAFGVRRSGPGWAIAQLLAGAAGSWVAVRVGERQPLPPAQSADGRAEPAEEPASRPQGTAA